MNDTYSIALMQQTYPHRGPHMLVIEGKGGTHIQLEMTEHLALGLIEMGHGYLKSLKKPDPLTIAQETLELSNKTVEVLERGNGEKS